MKRATRKTGPKLRLWQEALTYGLIGGLAVSGLGWLLLHNFGQAQGEFGPSQNPAERPLIVIHGILSFGFLLLAGALLEGHVRAAWKPGRNRITGIALLGLVGLEAATALGLYYLPDGLARSLGSIAHWSSGVAVLLVLGVHALARWQGPDVRAARRSRRRSRAREPA